MLPNGKTEYTASKTVTLDATAGYGSTSYGTGTGDSVDLSQYGLPNDLGPLESLSHTEQITAAYGTKSPYDLYHQMNKQKQTPEEIYIAKHPNEGYDYKPTSYKDEHNNAYKYDNYHANTGGYNKNPLNDLTPIIAALEVAKQKHPIKSQVSYAIEKHIQKVPGPNGPVQHLPPAVQKTKYIYYQPTPAKYEYHTQYNRPSYNGPYKVRRRSIDVAASSRPKRMVYTPQSETYDEMLFNPLMIDV